LQYLIAGTIAIAAGKLPTNSRVGLQHVGLHVYSASTSSSPSPPSYSYSSSKYIITVVINNIAIISNFCFFVSIFKFNCY